MSTAPAAAAYSSSTPILDRLLPAPPPLQRSAKQRRVSGILATIAVMVPAILISLMISSSTVRDFLFPTTQRLGSFIDSTMKRVYPPDMDGIMMLWAIFCPLLAVLVIVAVHEIGHMVAGMSLGFRIISVRIGPLQISSPFKVKWLRRNPVPGASGFVVLVPIHGHRLRSRAIAMLLGGAMANLISALVVVVLSAPRTGIFSTWFVVFSILVGIVNLVPFRRLALVSDGKRILMLLRNSRQGERWLALLQLIADLRNEVQSDHLRPDFLAIVTAVQDDSPETVTSHTIAYSAAYYKHDDAEASRLLEVCLKYLGFASPLIREAVLTDAVIFQARRRKRTDLAQQWLAEIPEKTIVPEHRFAADAAILEGQGDLQGALKKMDEAETVISGLADPIRRKLSLRSLQRARSELVGRLERAAS